MGDTAATTDFRSNLLRCALAIAVGVGLLTPTPCRQAVIAQESDRMRACYFSMATLRYERVNITGTDSELSRTGFTVTRVPAKDSANARMAVSGAFAIDKPKSQNLRLVARDHAGNLHLATEQTVAAATGSKRRVITLLCEFALPEQSIHELVVQRRVMVGEVDLGMVRAKIIIDEDEEEELLPGYDQ